MTTNNEFNMDYLKSTKIIDDLKECEEYLIGACKSKHDKTLLPVCKALLDLDRCRIFLEIEFHKGDLSFHTYALGSFVRNSSWPKIIFSYDEATKIIKRVLDRVKDEDEKITAMLANIVTLIMEETNLTNFKKWNCENCRGYTLDTQNGCWRICDFADDKTLQLICDLKECPKIHKKL